MIVRSALFVWACFAIGNAEDDVVDDANIHELLAHRARAPGWEDEVHQLVSEYPDMGSESELIEMLSKVDSRAEMTLFHKNRRRKNDSPARACESRGSDPDGDDDDCHRRRYQLIKGMLQPMKELHQDNTELQSESNSLQQRWKLANAELEEAMGLTYGPGFSKDNPSKNTGLISEFGLLAGSLLSLKDAAIAAADEAWAELDKVHYGVIVDVDTMKGEADKRLDTLVKGIQFQSSMQAEAQMQNMISLNKLGNKYMQQAVGSINKGQLPVEQGMRQTMGARETMERSTEGFLEDAENLLDDLSDEIQEVPEVSLEAHEKAQNKAEQEVDKVRDELEIAADHTLNEFTKQTDGRTDKLMESGEKQIEEQTAEAHEREEARRKDGEMKVEQQTEDVESLQEEMQHKYDSAENKADERMERFRNETEAPLSHDSNMSGDLNEAMKKVEAMLAKFEEGMQTGSSGLEQQRKEKLTPLKRAVSELRASSGSHLGELFMTMDSSMANANRDMDSASRLEMRNVMGKVIGMQRQLGMQQSKMGGLVMQLQDALRSGEAGLVESLKMQINGLDAEITQTSAAMQEAMMGLALKMQQEGSALKSESYATGRKIGGEISQGVKETENRMKGALRDLEHTEDNVQMTMDANKRAHINAIKHAMMSAKGVDAALAGIEREEHKIKSEFMSQQRDSRSTLARLGTSISKQEAAFLNALSKALATSHSNGRRAVDEEANAANRGFREVAGDASRDIQNVESENFRTGRDLRSKMTSSARRGQELGVELADIEKDMEHVMAEKVQDLAEESQQFTRTLDKQAISNEHEVESLRGRFSQIQGGLEKEIRGELKSGMDMTSQRSREVLAKAQTELDEGQKQYLEDKTRSSVMTKKLTSDATRFDKHTKKFEDELDAILEGIEFTKSQFDDETRGLNTKFAKVSGGEAGRLSHRTEELEKKLADIPQVFDRAAKQIEKEALDTTKDIDLRITKLNERANTKETEEEKDEAEEGIRIMEQLKKLANKDRADDTKMKGVLLKSDDVNNERTQEVQESMKRVTGNLEAIEDAVGAENNELGDEVREFGQRDTGLLSGAQGAVVQVESMLGKELQEGRAGNKFDIETSHMGNARRLEKTEAEKDHAAILARHEEAIFQGLEHSAKNNISGVFKKAQDSKLRMTKTLSNVMGELGKIQMDFEGAEAGDSSDIAIRLAHTRQAVKSILQLWDEYSQVMGKNLKRFQKDDAEFIEQLTMRLHQAMLKAEDILTKSVDEVNKLHRKLDMGYVQSKEFESNMEDSVKRMKVEEAKVSNRTEALAERVRDKLAEMERKQNELDDEALRNARETVDKMEEDITEKADQVLVSVGLLADNSAPPSNTPPPAAPSGPGGPP
ncbi:hypothetical protein FOZ61_005944 [Perkinsus olseni]|uniref:Uncharacterized protein n=1 Tax=Perkinsus olseni TaxID=32597 RepID=A0A7J6MAR0_PEROL|nr:hypothetical protein FOZ61_005944 [Perkinsus olseni]